MPATWKGIENNALEQVSLPRPMVCPRPGWSRFL